MNDQELKKLGEKLREAVPPVRDPELRRDLWPTMLEKMKEPHLRVPWYDWLLLAASGLAAFLFPSLIPALLYHL
jgi:hypothetical protein